MNDSIKTLASRRQADGSFAASRNGDEARPDATAWAALGLKAAASGEYAPAIEGARRQLLGLQAADGRVPITPRHIQVCWATPLVALAWHGWPAGKEAAARALDFLDHVESATFKDGTRATNAIDASLRGWSWIGSTACWVEPTALAVFAFQRFGRKVERVEEGIKLLLDRQLPQGGWNYGNTIVLGAELLVAEEYVGLALTGLAGNCDASQVARSLDLIEGRLSHVRTPLALAWGILGLSAWNRRPAESDKWIAECLARQDRSGAFDTTHLALLAIAGACHAGLTELFPSTP